MACASFDVIRSHVISFKWHEASFSPASMVDIKSKRLQGEGCTNRFALLRFKGESSVCVIYAVTIQRWVFSLCDTWKGLEWRGSPKRGPLWVALSDLSFMLNVTKARQRADLIHSTTRTSCPLTHLSARFHSRLFVHCHHHHIIYNYLKLQNKCSILAQPRDNRSGNCGVVSNVKTATGGSSSRFSIFYPLP